VHEEEEEEEEEEEDHGHFRMSEGWEPQYDTCVGSVGSRTMPNVRVVVYLDAGSYTDQTTPKRTYTQIKHHLNVWFDVLF
jgi:hypothetical protein